MKKSLFIAGTIFFVLSVVAFSFGTYILYVATHAESAGDAVAAVLPVKSEKRKHLLCGELAPEAEKLSR